MVSVLVVEDEGIVGLNLQRQLKGAGYDVPAVAASADEALAGIKTHTPDVVLMDIHIRGPRDGIQAAEEIRQTSQTPVIFLTAHSDKGTLDRARKTVPSGYLVKPVPFLSLTSTIEMAANRSSLADEAQSARTNNRPGAPEETTERQRFTQTLVNQLPSPIALVDASGSILYANAHLEKILGYERNQLTGQRLPALNIQNDKGALHVDSVLTLAASSSGPLDLVGSWSVVRKGGQVIPVKISFSPFAIDEQKLLLLTISDLSKQRDPGAVSQMFESLVTSVKDYAIFMLSPEGIVLTWNEGAKSIKGYSAEEIIGKHFSCFYTPEDIHKEHPQEELRKALETGRFMEEGWRVRRDRSRFWASVIITPIYDKQGHHTGFSKVTHDVTERKAADNALRKSEQEFRTLADAIPQIVWIAAADGRSFYNNRRWYEFSGFPVPKERAELPLRERWTSLVHPEEEQRAFDSWMAAIRSRTPFEGEYRLWDFQKREHRWYLARALPVLDENGEISRWFGTLTDIHDRKTAADELESEVQRRTEALSDSLEQIKAKEEMLQQSLVEKNVLLKEIHHRVKNNLQIISSLLNMQASNLDNEAAVAPLRESQRRVLSMALIHEQLYSTDTMSSVEFAEYLAKLVPVICASYAEKDSIRFNLDLQPTVLTIDQAIPGSLILNELITNALKYAYPTGQQGEITVSLHSTADRVELKVADRGVGLPAGFAAVQRRTLGMQIIETLTKQLAGTLEVDGTAGASFTIRFPREAS